MPRVSGMLVISAMLVIASSAVAQQPGAALPDTNAIAPAAIDVGRALFHGKGTCFACHGAQLEGTQVAPTLKAHDWRDAKNGQLDEIFRVLTHGVSSTLMVAFPGGISRPEALNIAAYIWSVNNRKAKP